MCEPAFLALAPEGRLRPRRPAGRRPLREDGPQRHRVRTHAGLRRGLRDHVRGPRVRPRPPRDRRHLALRLGGPVLAAGAGRAGTAARVGVRPDRRGGGRLGRGPMDGRRGHRPGGVGPGHLLGPLRPLRVTEDRTPSGSGWCPPCATSSAAMRSPPPPAPSAARRGHRSDHRSRLHRRLHGRRRDPGSDTTSVAEGERRTLPPVLSKAPPVAMVIFGASGDLTGAQDPAGPGPAGRPGCSRRRVHGHRRGPHGVDRRGVPQPCHRVHS